MNEIVVVTGGARGLGLAIVQQLIDAGYCVIVVSRTDTKELQDIKTDRLGFLEYDLNDLNGIYQLSRDIQAMAMNRFDSTIYGLINNAAIGIDGVLGTMHHKDISQILNVNVQAPILLTKFISRNMMLHGVKGRIVNIGSIIGSTGYSGLSVYGASKAALEGFTRSLARELGKSGIAVNLVAPGFMESHMTASISEAQLEQIRRRSATGELTSLQSVAAMVLYLLSPQGASTAGAILTVDGGSTA